MEHSKRSRAWTAASICMVIILLSSILASGLQSSWGGVRVTDLRDQTNSGPWAGDAQVMVNGKVVSGILFVPRGASAEHPLPAVVLTHGYLNSRELQLQNAIELARRGFVTLTIDREAHGNYENRGTSNSVFSRGLYDAAKYLYNLDFVDKSKIGISGHSMGGCDAAGVLMEDAANAAELSMSVLGKFLGTFGREDLTPQNGYALGIVSSALIQGWDNIPGAGKDVSVGILKASDDEFFFGSTSWANGGNTLGDGSPALCRQYLQSAYGARFVGVADTGDISIQNKGIYQNGELVQVPAGSAAAPGFRVIYENKQIHPQNHFSTKAAGEVANFFYTAYGTPDGAVYIPETSQVWLIKELLSFVGLLAFFALILPLAELMLSIPFFASLRRQSELVYAPPLKGLQKQVSFWFTGIACTLFSGFSLYKVSTSLGAKWFPLTPAYPQDTTNWVVIWAIACGLFALTLTLIVWGINSVLDRHKKQEERYTLNPVTPGRIEGGLGALVKTLLLAGLLVFSVYLVLYLVWGIWKVDFRIWTFDVKVFDVPTMLPTMLRYAVLFGIFYCINSILNNNYRVSNLPEWASIIVNVLFNIAGIALVIGIQYVTFAQRGTLWQPKMNLAYIVMFSILPILTVATVLSRMLYKKTGNAWLGGFVNALLFTIITCANTASSFSYILG